MTFIISLQIECKTLFDPEALPDPKTCLACLVVRLNIKFVMIDKQILNNRIVEKTSSHKNYDFFAYVGLNGWALLAIFSM